MSILGESKRKAKWNRDRLLNGDSDGTDFLNLLVLFKTKEQPDMKGYCVGCDNKELCFKLCPEAEKYVNQDVKIVYKAREIPMSYMIENVPSDITIWQEAIVSLGRAAWRIISGAKLSKRQSDILYSRFWLNKTIKEIEKGMDISRKTVWKHLAFAKIKVMTVLGEKKGPDDVVLIAMQEVIDNGKKRILYSL